MSFASPSAFRNILSLVLVSLVCTWSAKAEAVVMIAHAILSTQGRNSYGNRNVIKLLTVSLRSPLVSYWNGQVAHMHHCLVVTLQTLWCLTFLNLHLTFQCWKAIYFACTSRAKHFLLQSCVISLLGSKVHSYNNIANSIAVKVLPTAEHVY